VANPSKNPHRRGSAGAIPSDVFKLADRPRRLSILEKNFPIVRSGARIAWLLLVLILIQTMSAIADSPEAGNGDAATLELEGTWYLLVHYRDREAPDPDAWLWLDKVWRFQEKGSRLKWSEFPIVIFRDEDSRFETLGSGRKTRVPGVWSPTPEQLTEIQEGPRVNARDALSKTLRGDPRRGYGSAGAMRTGSASVIGFTQRWEIRDLDGLPVFLRADEMGSARTESLQGETSYETTELRDGGNELVGRFERDGVLHGSFRLIRAGEVRILGAKSKRPE